MARKEKNVIGRWDRVDLPDLGLSDIQAKVDTGAYTCALHVSQLRRFIKAEQSFVEFKLLHPRAKSDELISVPLHARRRIKSSNGQSRMRYIIRTKVVVFGRSIMAEFSLSDRSRMDFPVLLGRKLLNGRFLVDVSKKDISWKQKKLKSLSAT